MEAKKPKLTCPESVQLDPRASIDRYITQLEEGHRIHRKIKFLLDIRGFLVVNKIKGDYVEFGIFRGEMMYAATKILSHVIEKFIGLDTFEGLPKPREDDERIFVFEKQGFMDSPKKAAEELLENSNFVLIEGDFREKAVSDQLKKEVSKISVLSVDCNWPSSIVASIRESMPFLQHGSAIFFDDYFAGPNQRQFHEKLLKEEGEKHGLAFFEFMTYPPSARAFIVENK